MEDYNSKLTTLLQEYIGNRNPLFVDFREIDESTDKSSLDFRKVKGSVRLSNPYKVLLPKDTEPIVRQFLSIQIP